MFRQVEDCFRKINHDRFFEKVQETKEDGLTFNYKFIQYKHRTDEKYFPVQTLIKEISHIQISRKFTQAIQK